MARFNTVQEALEDFRAGKFLIVLDDEDRENEGDLIIAAEHITTEKMAFLVRWSSGYVCAPLSQQRADQLKLPYMLDPSEQTDRHGTAYTITVDYAEGTTTGISAQDRALTCRKLADPTSKAEEFLRPGHIVPLRAVDGGVVARAGHTEASVDLCRLSGLQPAAVICELVREEDGLMARRDDCFKFAEKWGLKVITIVALKEYIQSQANGQ